MRLNRLTSRARSRGQALLWVLGIGVVIGISAMMISRAIVQTSADAFDDERKFEARMLATNLKEIAKYLLLYEKIIYTGNSGAVGPTTIDTDMLSLWKQTFTEVEQANGGLITACGGYSVGAIYLGEHHINNKQVFCPMYVRSNLFSGAMVEQMIFTLWSGGAPKPIMTPSGAGRYSIVLDFANVLDAAANKIVGLDPRQKLLREKTRRALEAKVTMTFATDSAGFRAVAAERYVTLTAHVSFLGWPRGRHYVEETETFLMALATPKDFAFFIPFPVANNPSLANSLNFSNPKGVRIIGRTYFNGNLVLDPADIAGSIDALPNFEDTLVLSGNFQPVPTAKHLDLLRRKFKRGILTNYSAARYLFDGKCDKNAVTDVQNQSQMYCQGPAVVGSTCPSKGLPNDRITNYISENLGSNDLCWMGDITVNGGSEIRYSPRCSMTASDQCADSGIWLEAYDRNSKKSLPPTLPVHGGFLNVTVDNSYATIITPLQKLLVTRDGATIYGLIFGGGVDVNVNKAVFRSLSNAAVGMPGIVSNEIMAEMNAAAALAYEGTSIPLMNLPVVYTTGEGSR